MARWWLPLLVVACSSTAAPLANTQPAPAAPQLTDRDAVVAAVLERFLADPKTLPDHGILPATGPIYVLAELDDHGAVTPAALPRAPRPFKLATQREIDGEADRTNQPVHYIRFYGLEIHGDAATIGSGVDLAIPKASNAIKMCCCSATDRYEKRAGRWTFASRGMSICS